MKKNKQNKGLLNGIIVSGCLAIGVVLLIHSCDGSLFGNADQPLTLWSILLIFIGVAAILGAHFLLPKLEIKDGRLCFFASNTTFLKRVRIPLDTIDAVAAHRRKSGGAAKVHCLATFIVRLKDGSEYEYFPGLPEGKRLNAVRRILQSASAPQGIEPEAEGMADLEGGKGTSLMVVLILVGCLLLMFVLAYCTSRFL